MINTIIRYKTDNMKLAYYLYFLSSWRLTNKWNRHAYGYIVNRYFSRYTLTNSTVVSSSLITPTQATGQSGSSIAYFWKSRLLVTLAKITHSNALKWAMAHNESKNPDSVPIDITDCYEDDVDTSLSTLWL